MLAFSPGRRIDDNDRSVMPAPPPARGLFRFETDKPSSITLDSNHISVRLKDDWSDSVARSAEIDEHHGAEVGLRGIGKLINPQATQECLEAEYTGGDQRRLTWPFAPGTTPP
jgi:hypothetical protein